MAKNRGGTESLTRKIKALQEVKRTIPDKLASQGLAFFKKTFENEGFEDNNFQPWPRRKSIKQTHPILKKTGALKRSLVVERKSFDKIIWSSSLPYSAIHNYGGNGLAWGKHPFKMPKRKFIGDSKSLRMGFRRRIEVEVNRAMKA